MSEYQRYEFMTIDRPLTAQQLEEVNDLSSHIEASSTHALIEYHWGDFKHNPVDVLYRYFDGFLYWANWGSPHLALRFPHGVLPADLINNYDFDDFVTFTRHKDYDILDIQFAEMEAPDEWTEYELGSLIALREELMEGDQRPLYIAWLATQGVIGYLDDEEEEDAATEAPVVPPAFGQLTEAQKVLAQLLQVPRDLLFAVAHHSSPATPHVNDDFAAWIELLPLERRNNYLVRLAANEPGLSRLLVRELRELGQASRREAPFTGERVTYATLFAESKAMKEQLEREERERKRVARQRHLQDVHARQHELWHQVEQAVLRSSGAGYDEAVTLLIDLREAAGQFNEAQAFQERFRNWVQPYQRRPSLIKRLQDHKFKLP